MMSRWGRKEDGSPIVVPPYFVCCPAASVVSVACVRVRLTVVFIYVPFYCGREGFYRAGSVCSYAGKRALQGCRRP